MPLFALLLGCENEPAPPEAPFACPAGARPQSGEAEEHEVAWSCVDEQGRLTGPWSRRSGGEVIEEGAYEAGRRVGPWQAHHGYQVNDQQDTWRAAGAFADGVPTGVWTLSWTTMAEGPGGGVAMDRWTGTFLDGAPATTEAWDLPRALASQDALPAGPVTLRIPVQTVGGATIAPGTHACSGPLGAPIFSLGEEAPIVVDPHPVFAVDWSASLTGAASGALAAGPDPDFSRVQVAWKDAQPTGTIEAVTVFGTAATDARSVRACFAEPRPIARVLAWRVCGDANCGPWTGFWDRVFAEPGGPPSPARAP